MKIDETRHLPSKFLVVLRGWFRLNSDGHFLGGLEIQSHKNHISKWQAIWFQTNIRMQIHHILSWMDTCGFVVCCHRTWGIYVDGCFTWMIQNLYLGHVCFTKYPFNTGYLQFQIMIYMLLYILVGQMHHGFLKPCSSWGLLAYLPQALPAFWELFAPWRWAIFFRMGALYQGSQAGWNMRWKHRLTPGNHEIFLNFPPQKTRGRDKFLYKQASY